MINSLGIIINKDVRNVWAFWRIDKTTKVILVSCLRILFFCLLERQKWVDGLEQNVMEMGSEPVINPLNVGLDEGAEAGV